MIPDKIYIRHYWMPGELDDEWRLKPVEDEKSEFGKVYHLLVPTGFEKNSYTIQVTLFKEPICGVNVLFKCWGWIPPYNGGINDIHLCGIGFIHEMQHALRLCGIDKEITI